MASSGRKVTLVSFDGIEFVMEEAVAVQSLVIKDMIESGWASNARYPRSLITARALEKVVEHMKKHAGEDPESEAIKKFDLEFADGLEDNQEVLFGVLQVAYDLRIDGLFHLLCDKVASMLQGKPVEQIRELFHIKNDFTPDEEEEAQREFARIFE